MELISHTHPDNNRAMPDEGLFVWSRALSIIGGDVLAMHLLFESSICFLFVFYLFTLYIYSLDFLFIRSLFFFLFSSLLFVQYSNILLSPPY